MEDRALAVHRTIVAVDVERFGDQRRTNRNQLAVRDGLYGAMCEAFRDAEIPWADRDREDRGDGMFILVGSEVPKSLFVESLPSALVRALRRHNGAHPDLERIRLRMALHAGEVNYDEHGATAAAINLTFRLLESGPVKEALASSPGVLAVIASSWFFEEVVRHSAANAAAYHPVPVAVKETATTGWICLPDHVDWSGIQAVTGLRGIERHDSASSGWHGRQSVADLLARYRPRFPGTLPRVWKVPARNPNFTGRDEDLAALARDLASGSTVTVQSLRGMGGVGKTQLATEFAHAHAGDYDLVYWIAAEEPATIPDQFTGLARLLGLDPVLDPETLQGQVHEGLRSVPGWLLVFDNADAVADIRAWLPGGPLPPGIPGHVMVTTRRGGFAALGRVMELDVIDLAAAVTLLRTRVSDLDEDVAQEIAGELGRLPLALEQAAAYLDRSAMPPRDYLSLLRRRAADLYARGQVGGRHDTIATLWDIALQRISSEDPAAVVLLELCAYLAPEPIPLDLFSLHGDLLPEPLSSAAADELAFNEVIGTLVDYSLAKRTQSGLQLHRLVQGVIRARHALTSRSLARGD